MKHGSTKPEVMEAKYKKLGVPLPKKPEIDNLDKIFLDAFYTCSRSRNFSNEGVPLPLSIGNIRDYLEVFRVPLDHQLLTEVVLFIDDIVIEDAYEKLNKKSKNKSSSSKNIPI